MKDDLGYIDVFRTGKRGMFVYKKDMVVGIKSEKIVIVVGNNGSGRERWGFVFGSDVEHGTGRIREFRENGIVFEKGGLMRVVEFGNGDVVMDRLVRKYLDKEGWKGQDVVERGFSVLVNKLQARKEVEVSVCERHGVRLRKGVQEEGCVSCEDVERVVMPFREVREIFRMGGKNKELVVGVNEERNVVFMTSYRDCLNGYVVVMGGNCKGDMIGDKIIKDIML